MNWGYWLTVIGSVLTILGAILGLWGYLISPKDNLFVSAKNKFINIIQLQQIKNSPNSKNIQFNINAESGSIVSVGEAQVITPDDKKRYTPKFDIKLQQMNENIYKYPLRRYILMIQNTNRDSTVTKLRIKFTFNNKIKEIDPLLKLDYGEDFSAQVTEFVGTKADGTLYSYRPNSTESLKANNISFEIQRVTINRSEYNTNVLILNTKEWPKGSYFESYVVVDLSQEQDLLDFEEKGTYIGSYEYVIKDKIYTDNIRGKIIDLNR
jgi:hypothetical protein